MSKPTKELHVPRPDEIDAILFSEGGRIADRVLNDRFARETVTDADRLFDSQLPDETGHPVFEQYSPELIEIIRSADENDRDRSDDAFGML